MEEQETILINGDEKVADAVGQNLIYTIKIFTR